jgi:hypothetical protein
MERSDASGLSAQRTSRGSRKPFSRRRLTARRTAGTLHSPLDQALRMILIRSRRRAPCYEKERVISA